MRLGLGVTLIPQRPARRHGVRRRGRVRLRTDSTLERFTLGLRTDHIGKARLFRLKSESRLQPEGKPL